MTNASPWNLSPDSVIGILSDTHGLLRPQALAALRGSHLLIHSGDIGKPQVLDTLRELAPVIAVRGNNDTGKWSQHLPDIHQLNVGPFHILVLHNIQDVAWDDLSLPVHMIIAGHSHRPSIETRNGILVLNPGSAGPRRFNLPVSVARLNVSSNHLFPTLITLAP